MIEIYEQPGRSDRAPHKDHFFSEFFLLLLVSLMSLIKLAFGTTTLCRRRRFILSRTGVYYS
jgi:hypothetical protein